MDGGYRRRGGSRGSGVFAPLTQLHSAFQHKQELQKHRGGSGNGVAWNNRNIQLPPRPFAFRQRQGKLDTKTIAQIDLNRVVRDTDIDTIQNHLENLAFSDVTLQDVNQYSDEYFLKLFQIAQLSVEYLLNVQESLVQHTEDLENQCNQITSECKQLEDENEKYDAEVSMLKQEIKQKQNTIATFEMMLLSQQHNNPTASTPSPASTPVDCVFCNKKFLTIEYLVKHQKKKHFDDYTKLKQRKTSSSKSVDIPQPTSPIVHEPVNPPQVIEPVKPPTPAVAQPDAALVSALVTANTSALTKQIDVLQAQLVQDKADRARETQLLQQQQNAFAQSIVEQLARMQQALQDMQSKTQSEWMHFTEEMMKKTTPPPRVPVEHIGPMTNDTDEKDKLTRDMVQDLMKQREKELERRLQLEAEQRAWAARELELKQQLLEEKQKQTANELTLTHLMALEAQKYGLDYGLPKEPKIEVVQVPVVQNDPPVQESIPKQPKPLEEEAIEVPPKPKKELPKPAPIEKKKSMPAAEPKTIFTPPPLKKVDSIPVIESKPVTKSEVQQEEPPVAAPPVSIDPPEDKSIKPDEESLRQHAAATKIRKIVVGYLTRKFLAHPHNWLLRIQGHEFFVPVTHVMTALQVRQIIASELGGIDIHRVLLHDAITGTEISGKTLVFDLCGHLEIEIIPAIHNDNHHFAFIDEMVDDMTAKKSRILSLAIQNEPPNQLVSENEKVVHSIVMIQKYARGMLARREAAGRRIDHLIDERIAQNLAFESHLVKVIRPSKQTEHRKRVQDALAEKLVALQVTKAKDRIPKQISNEDFEASMEKLQAARKEYSPELQSRISSIITMIHDTALAEYDPIAAKEQETMGDAAASIQSVVRVILARKVIKSMRERHKQTASLVAAEPKNEDIQEKSSKHIMANGKESSSKEPSTEDGMMVVDEFNGDIPGHQEAKETEKDAQTNQDIEEIESKPLAIPEAKSVVLDEYEEEREQLKAMKENEAKVISPFSNTALKPMRSSARRGSISHNAR
ncbi:hypothetical protein THRCLA_11090 [Thraustotheca clavata]|uniref:C2H2-type domain-containing protein n=1 Tax=Thraustotheca clavata TaxID=74557 RepID=A0A1V9Y8V4_9STRA|nr:hypothetical protein THRCLA_11090 [Thraustotheca clavata]